MVTIPSATSTQRLRGRNQQGAFATTNAEQMGAGIGRGLANLAQGVGDIAKVMDARDQLREQAAARKAADQYRSFLREGLHNPETGFLSTTGENASGEARQALFERAQAERDRLRQGLTDRAASVFDQTVSAVDNSAKDTAIRHESAQLRSVVVGSFDATIKGEVEDAAINADDINLWTQNMSAAEAAAREKAELLGLSPEETEESVRNIWQAGRRDRAVALSRTDPIAAWEYLQENKDKIDPGDFASLTEHLEPMMLKSEAMKWYSAGNARGLAATTVDSTGAAVDSNGFPLFITQPESTGNPNAKNPKSSAAGIVQFVKSTWMAYIKKTNPAWAVGLTEQEVLDGRFDVAKVRPIYQAFRKDNQRALKTMGASITPRNEYMIHHLGPGVTRAILKAEATGTSAGSLKALLTQVLGADEAADWIKKNDWMVGKTTRQAISWFEAKTSPWVGGAAGHEGAGGAGGGTTEAALMQDALNETNPKLREAKLRELQLRRQMRIQMQDDAEREALDAAWDIIDKGGSSTDIPIELQQTIGVAKMNTIRDAEERQAIGVDTNDEDRQRELEALAFSDDPEERKAFMDMDLRDEKATLSRAIMDRLVREQDSMRDARRNELAGASEVTATRLASAERDAKLRFKARMGFDPTRSKATEEEAEQYADFLLQFRQAYHAEAKELGRPLSAAEIDRAVVRLLAPIEVDTGGTFSNTSGRLFQLPKLRRTGTEHFELQYEIEDVIAAGAVPAIQQALERRLQREVTDDEIVEHYENNVLLAMGIEPSFTVDDIPNDIKKSLIQTSPGTGLPSDELLVEQYRQLMLGSAKDLGLLPSTNATEPAEGEEPSSGPTSGPAAGNIIPGGG